MDATTRTYIRRERDKHVRKRNTSHGHSHVLGQGTRPSHWPALIIIERDGTRAKT